MREIFYSETETFCYSGDVGQNEQFRDRIRREQKLVLQLEQDLQLRDAALEQARTELEQQRTARSRRDSYSTDRELSVFYEQVRSEIRSLRGLKSNN